MASQALPVAQIISKLHITNLLYNISNTRKTVINSQAFISYPRIYQMGQCCECLETNSTNNSKMRP